MTLATVASPPVAKHPQTFASTGAETLPLAVSTGKAVRVLIGLKLADLGLVVGQDQALIALASHPGLTVTELAEELSVRASTISKMLTRLEAKGLTRRINHPSDARCIQMELTEKGLELRNEIGEVYDDLARILISTLTSSEIERMLDGMALIDKVVHHQLRRLR